MEQRKEIPIGLIPDTDEKEEPIDDFNQVALTDTLSPVIYFTQGGCKLFLPSENRWAKITPDFMLMITQKYYEY